MPKQFPTPDPRDVVSGFRTTYRNYSTAAPRRETVASLDEAALPEGARRAFERYRREHGDEQLDLVKHLRIVNGTPEVVIDDDSPLPATPELLTLSETVTLTTDDRLEVVTDVFVVRRT